MSQYSIGLDYGTNSCRALLIDLQDGSELASAVFEYPSGEHGVLIDSQDPNVARQNPQDYIDGLVAVIHAVLAQAQRDHQSFDASQIVGLGIDTTGSTPIPMDRFGVPLALKPEFRDHLEAAVWLWKDHTSHAEAAEITRVAASMRPEYLAKCGGIYSSEWWWSKIWRCLKVAPEVFEAAWTWAEHCDWLPHLLSGNTSPMTWKRSGCAAGHKAMYAEEWGGLPDKAFLNALDPRLGSLRDRLYDRAWSSDEPAGYLTEEWAERLGLPAGIPLAVGAFDAHMGAVGAGVKEGTLVKILGTSTCDITVVAEGALLQDVPGLCGIAKGSVLPGHLGIEAGQSAVGDLFLWWVHQMVPDSYGDTPRAKFEAMERRLKTLQPGETGLLALDWNNGNRTVLTDHRLTGLIVGQTLYTEAHEIYRALIEATAFGALTIIRRMEAHGIPIDEVINTGGLAVKNATLMQIYADILNRPLKVAASEQTCALGAAIYGAVSAGVGSVGEIQARCCQLRSEVYEPIPAHAAVYAAIYDLYRELHDVFGTPTASQNLHHVMKTLISIREKQRQARSEP